MIKQYKGKAASFAKGGEVLHTSNSRFIKTPDRFRDAQFRSKTEVPAPEAKQKSLAPVKPRS
jgi:hypothetical protein